MADVVDGHDGKEMGCGLSMISSRYRQGKGLFRAGFQAFHQVCLCRLQEFNRLPEVSQGRLDRDVPFAKTLATILDFPECDVKHNLFDGPDAIVQSLDCIT